MIVYVLTILLFTSGTFSAPTRHEEPEVDSHLRDEFSNFVKERLNRAIELSHHSPPRYLLISVTLTDSACNKHNTAQNISIGETQTIWVEENCGTKGMRKWCYEFPGRTLNLMTGTEDMSTSAMAQIRCDAPTAAIDENSSTNWKKLIAPFAVLLFILGVIWNFRRFCKEQETIKRTQAMQNMIDSSMDTIILDSSCKEHSRKEIARFDDESDPTLGTLFTI